MQEQMVSPKVSLIRQGLIRDIRNLSRQSIKHRTRSEMIIKLSQEDLVALIENTQSNIQIPQLHALVKYANLQYPKAIAHLGNLLLDGIVTVQQLQRYNLKPGYHPYWLWLIEVLVQKQYCTLSLVQHCINSLSSHRLQPTTKRSLSILYKITTSALNSPLLLRDQKALISVLNTTLRNDSASEMGFLLIYQAIKTSNQEISSRLEGSLRNRFVQIIMNGSLKEGHLIRLLILKILKQLIQKGVYFQQLTQITLGFLREEREEQHSQLVLEYFSNLIKLAHSQILQRMLNLGLVIELAQLKFFHEQNEVLQLKVIQVAREIDQRASDWGYLSKGVRKQLQKYHLLTASYKMELC